MFRSFLMGAWALCAVGCGSDDESAKQPTQPTGRQLGPPVVISDLTCDADKHRDAPPPLVTIGGRQVIVDYPCDLPSGSPVTFILNLHGTQTVEALKQYLRPYLGSLKYVGSHRFIIATPNSVVSQWGNGDEGKDEPHIMEVIDWMYETFKGFDIVNMWVAGHSWGAFYTAGFVCKPELEDRVTGAVLMSGGARIPECSDRLALIGTVGETDIVPGELPQDDVAAAHGCGPKEVTQLGNNTFTQWPNCNPGFVHQSYLMLGKGHGFDPVDWPDEGMTLNIADAMVTARGE